MEEKKYTVYIHTVIENNKKYVGITCRDPQKRWGYNGCQYKGQVFYNAIQKYGWKNINHEIIAENLTKEEACDMEKELIKKYNTTNKKFGYNRSIGGECSALGIVHTEEARKKMSQSKSGEKNCMYGKKHSEETRRKISEKLKGRTISDEQRKFVSEFMKGHKGVNNRKVVLDGVEFESITACAKYIGKSNTTVTDWLNKKSFMPKEYIERGLRYLGDNDTVYEPKENERWYKVICEGVVYDTITECAEKYKVVPGTMRHWLINGSAPKKFCDMGLRFLNSEEPLKIKKLEHKKRVTCEGIIFNSIKECADFYKISSGNISAWLNGKRKMPKRFVEKGLSLL